MTIASHAKECTEANDSTKVAKDGCGSEYVSKNIARVNYHAKRHYYFIFSKIQANITIEVTINNLPCS